MPHVADDRRYRRDIDGLRAVSILAVVGFHAGIASLAGGYVGVDVFFVVSGYLITGLLIGEVERSGTVSLREFYARRIRRLLPLSATVLVTTLVLGAWLVAPTARRALVGDAQAAALYVANWRYAGQATAYSDTNVEDGLLVHFWSLAIEEQFYFVWPLLILAAAWIGRRSRLPFRAVLGATLTLVIAASFGASLILTADSGPRAYYVTHTRIWELGAGALLAVIGSRLPSAGHAVNQMLSALGLGLIAAAVLLFDYTTAFPGSAALLPVVGTVLLVATGRSGTTAISRTLSLRPFVSLGRLSYAWYLIHWPAIGLSLLLQQRYFDTASTWIATTVGVAGSLGLAWMANRWIENPVRRHHLLVGRVRPNFALGAALSTVPLLVGFLVINGADLGESRRVVLAEDGSTIEAMSPAQAANDTVDLGLDCHNNWKTVELAEACVFGDVDGEFVVALVGDSHARQWLPALDRIGQSQGWQVHAWTKSACSIIDAPIYSVGLERSYDECAEWRGLVTDELRSLGGPDLVILARAASYRKAVIDGDEIIEGDITAEWAAGAERTFSDMTSLSDNVVLLADTPWAPSRIPDCLSSTNDPTDCTFERAAAIRDGELLDIERPIAARLGLRIVDVTPLICGDTDCPAMTDDGIITYRDTNHLTVTFTQTIAADFANAVVGVEA